MTHFEEALFEEVQLLALSHTIFISCLQPRERGTQPTATSQMATGWDPAAWAGASPSALYGSGM